MEYPYIDIHTHKLCRGGKFIYSHRLLHEPLPGGVKCFSAGIHPWDLDLINTQTDLTQLFDLPIVALGEVGLDYAVKQLDKQTQINAFQDQLQVAKNKSLPVIMHSVRAFEDTVKILSGFKLKAVIFHSFTGNAFQAKVLLDKKWFISLSDRSLLSNKTVEGLKSFPKSILLESLFLETDDAEFEIDEIYKMASEKLEISEHDLKESIYKNYNRIFG